VEIISNITSIFKEVGDRTTKISAWIIKNVSELGINATPSHIKILTLIINLVLIYLFLKVITIPQKILKWSIIILLAILTISIIISLLI